jgi:hypothetical protein
MPGGDGATTCATWPGSPFPVAVHLLILRHFWFNAPVWDDYAVVDSVLHVLDAGSFRDWMRHLVAQHNEHRVALARFVEWALITATGHVDFRALALVGNLFLVGLLALAWAQFREQVAPIGFAAAAWMLFNWSYFEAALISMATLCNIGVILAAFACLHFALRGGWASAAASVGAGIVAAFTQGKRPLRAAAGGRGMRGHGTRGKGGRDGRRRRRRCGSPTFRGYVRPPNHPSPFLALSRPIDTAHLFVVVIGGLLPTKWAATFIGAAILSALGWLCGAGCGGRIRPSPSGSPSSSFRTRRPRWTRAEAFGVFHASAYAINASILAAIVVLGFWALAGPRDGGREAVVAAHRRNIGLATRRTGRSRRKRRSLPGCSPRRYPPRGTTVHDPYYGFRYPDTRYAREVLAWAERSGMYTPPVVTVHPFAVTTLAEAPAKPAPSAASTR